MFKFTKWISLWPKWTHYTDSKTWSHWPINIWTKNTHQSIIYDPIINMQLFLFTYKSRNMSVWHLAWIFLTLECLSYIRDWCYYSYWSLWKLLRWWLLFVSADMLRLRWLLLMQWLIWNAYLLNFTCEFFFIISNIFYWDIGVNKFFPFIGWMTLAYALMYITILRNSWNISLGFLFHPVDVTDRLHEISTKSQHLQEKSIAFQIHNKSVTILFQLKLHIATMVRT